MAKKITQYPASGGNPDVGSLIDISELSGGTYTSKKLTIQQLLDYLSTNLDFGNVQVFKNTTGATILKGTPCEIYSAQTLIPLVSTINDSFENGLSKIYIATENILNNATGSFIENGIFQYDTSAFPVGSKVFVNWNDYSLTLDGTQEDQVFIGIVITQNIAGKIFASPTRNPQLIKGASGQVPLFMGERKINGNTHFTYVDNNGVEVGFRFSDNNNNLTQVGVTYLNVESEGLASNSVLRLANWASNTNKGIVSFRKSRGSKANPSQVLLNDVLGSMIFAGASTKTIDGIPATMTGMTTGEIVVRALASFAKYYDSNNDTTTSDGLTQFEIYLQQSNGFAFGDFTPANVKVFSVDGNGAVEFKNYRFPINAGTTGQVLTAGVGGLLNWTTPSTPSVTLPDSRIPYGSSGGTLTYDSNFLFFKSNIANSLYNRSTIYLFTYESDAQKGQSWIGAGQILQFSSDSLLELNQENQTTNLSKGGRLRLDVRDATLGSGNYALANQLLGEVQFGTDGARIGAIIKAFSEQAISNMDGTGSRLEFYTAPINSTSPVLAMKIDNTGKVYFKSYNFPLADGSAGQVLQTDGAGNISWGTGGSATDFIPRLKGNETFRGVNYGNNSTTEVTSGGITMATSASVSARSVSSTNFASKIIRKGFTASVVSTGRYTGTRGSSLLFYIGGGFKYVCDFYISDSAFSSINRQFFGLAGQTTDLGYTDTILVSSLLNCIGVGSDSADANLQIFYNDGAGACTKIDLGSNFPANRTAGAVLTTMYSVEIYNAPGTTSVKVQVTNKETGVISQNTLTTNLPLDTQGLNFFASRVMGSPITGTGQFDLAILGVYSL